jgi:hypothetical protein
MALLQILIPSNLERGARVDRCSGGDVEGNCQRLNVERNPRLTNSIVSKALFEASFLLLPGFGQSRL